MRDTISNNRGFTLIEALIAMFVLVVGILGVMAMQTSAVRANYRASTMTSASSVVFGQIEQIRRAPYSSLGETPEATGGSCDDPVTGTTGNYMVEPASGQCLTNYAGNPTTVSTSTIIDPATGYTVTWTMTNNSPVTGAKLVTVSVTVPNSGPTVRYEYVRYDDGT